jgi:beta-galactosidase/beta-glucuronidase
MMFLRNVLILAVSVYMCVGTGSVAAEENSPAASVGIPRSEYPRPQFVRQDWLCLNGQWEFETDPGDSGFERGVQNRSLKDKIIVPFCLESKLSGIGNTDFMNAVWYRRIVTIPAAWKGRKVLLHFQAVDYETTVWVNGKEVARHTGGFSGFDCDLEGVAEAGQTATIVVRARDLKNDTAKPKGKQSDRYSNYSCLYTRTTGIWQTVWMEPVSRVHIERPRITPDLANSMFHITVPITNSRAGTRLHVTLSDAKGIMSGATIAADSDFGPMVDMAIPAGRLRLWEPKDPFLYDIKFELSDSNNAVIDTVTSYAGMRSVTLDGMAFKLNGKTVFLRQVLDQGYYPDGILTAPTDEALRRDIELSMAAGFNGARLHQKVFEERFLYYCDKLGYLVWGEFGDWGEDRVNPQPTYITQWLEVLQRNYSHPSIIGWCGLNETGLDLTDERSELTEFTWGLFLAAKAIDCSRLVLDASGYSHRVPITDVYDSHNYEQNPQKFADAFKDLDKGKPFINSDRLSVPYRGQPYFCSEFGGIKWNPDTNVNSSNVSWGYGDAPKTIDEFYQRFEGLCNAQLDNPNIFGYCYTQLTDVFQEQNGMYRFDRSAKFDMDRIRKIQTRPAAIEKKSVPLKTEIK